MLAAHEDGDSPAAPDFLVILPKLLNGKRHEKNVQRRLAWAHQGRWAELMRERRWHGQPPNYRPRSRRMRWQKAG